ncbi:carboxypeptidase regulatory-like domain-containing protein [Cellulomonas shaoxiangyii]|uniref:alpha-amylase n=1 Tax=Cellulomonas shaoxiangyii TaxID=2566013 RepID=A0A4P7SHW6_9CELL|nr:carboxypeptidase regulatory-like domain-containing protein [Cellulomonas shaoxiangyii]TGY82620.1 carboxypeptidase regulatory-like domain-containing protein [Cellulomonas shaoxiangyii]
MPTSLPTPAPTSLPTPSPTGSTGRSQLSGRVTDVDGEPVAGVRVEAHGSGLGWAVTDASGAWTIGGLPAGSYRIRFEAFAAGLAPEYWDDAPSMMTGTVVRVAEGEAVAGLDAQLAPGAVVRGRVVDPAGAPVAFATVSVERLDVPGVPPSGAYTDADGTYEVRALAAGTYRLKVVPAPDSGLSTTWWTRTADAAAATPLTLATGQHREGVDVTPLPGSGIAGTVTAPAGVPLEELTVVVQEAGPDGSLRTVGGTTPAADGTYRFTDLAPGTYLVRVEHVDWNGPLLPEYYRDSTSAERAVPVEVTVGEVVGGIDLTPGRAARITGVVTGRDGPVQGVEVTLVPRSGQLGTWGFAETGQAGEFLIGRLPAGRYAVRFALPDGSVRYFRAPSGTTPHLHAATSVRVPAGGSVEITARLRGGPASVG